MALGVIGQACERTEGFAIAKPATVRLISVEQARSAKYGCKAESPCQSTFRSRFALDGAGRGVQDQRRRRPQRRSRTGGSLFRLARRHGQDSSKDRATEPKFIGVAAKARGAAQVFFRRARDRWHAARSPGAASLAAHTSLTERSVSSICMACTAWMDRCS